MINSWPELAPTVLVDTRTKEAETTLGNLTSLDIDIEGYVNFLKSQGATDEQIKDLCIVFTEKGLRPDFHGLDTVGYYTRNFRDERLDPNESLFGRSVIVIHPEFLWPSKNLLHETSHFLDRPAIGEGRRRRRIYEELVFKLGRSALMEDASNVTKLKFLSLAAPGHYASKLVPKKLSTWHYQRVDQEERDARKFAMQHIGQDFVLITLRMTSGSVKLP